MAFAWGDAAGAMVNEGRKQRTEAVDLEQALAERAYKQALIAQAQQQQEIQRQRMAMDQEQFQATRDERATTRRQAENERGVTAMVGELIRREGITPQNRGQIVGTLMEAGRMPTADDLAGPQGADPFTLGPGQKRFSPDGNVIAEGLPPSESGAAGFTLSPGGVRYSADGQVIASRPAAPAGSGGGTRRVTSGDANRMAEFDSALSDLATLKEQIGKTGSASRVGAMLPNVVTEMTGIGVDAKQRQALIDRVKQVIGKTLEGGVLRKEDEYKYTKILPTIGDHPDVATAKLDSLAQAIGARRGIQLDALEDAQYDVTNFRARENGAPATTRQKWTKDAKGRPVKVQ
jgi:hypothetical protein